MAKVPFETAYELFQAALDVARSATDHAGRLTTALPDSETYEGEFTYELSLGAMHGNAKWPTIEMNSKSEKRIELCLDPASGHLHITHEAEALGTPFYLAFSTYRTRWEDRSWPTPLLRAHFAAARLQGEPRVEAILGVALRLLPHPVRDDLIAHAGMAARALPDESARERWLGVIDGASHSPPAGDGPVPGDSRIADERFVMLRKSGKHSGAKVDLRCLPFKNKDEVRVIFKRALPPELAVAPDVLGRSLEGLNGVDGDAVEPWRAWLWANLAGHPDLQRLLALLRGGVE